MLALVVAFWFQLDSPSSAAVCVVILAQPTRGQALSKSIYRMSATVIGAVAAIVLCTLFPQSRFLLLGGIGLWLALCTFVGTLERDFRAYGAMLSGYTAAIVGAAAIDAPDGVFLSAANRVAVIAVGVAASTLVNDAFGAPDAWKRLAASLRTQADRVQALFGDALAGRGVPDDAACADLAAGILQLGGQASYARTELQDGHQRAAGARSAIVALLELLSDSRAIAAAYGSGELEASFAARVRTAGEDRTALDALELHPPDMSPAGVADAFLLERARTALDQQALVQDGLHALETGSKPGRIVRLTPHHDYYAGLLNAIRVLIAFALATGFCVLSGLPDSTLLLINVAAMCALSSINPNPNAFGWGVLIGAPIAVTLAAVVTFVPLTQGSSLVVLGLSLLPPMVFGCLLSLNPATGTVGFIALVWMFIAISPGNPQSFDLLAFTERGMFLILSAVIVFMSMNFLLPASPRRRMFRIADAIVQDLETGARGDAATLVSRHYDRLVQARGWMKQRPQTPARQAVFSRLTALAHLAGAIGRARRALDQAREDAALAGAAAAAQQALAGNDPQAMRDSAVDVLAAARKVDPAARAIALRVASGLYGTAVLTEMNARMMRVTRIRPGFAG